MSSRAASGRKRLRPAPTAPPPVPTLPQSVTNKFARPQIDSNVHSTSPQALPTPVSPMYLRSPPSPSPSTPSFSSAGFAPPYRSQSSRDDISRSPRSPDSATATISPYPYPAPTQTQVYQPPPLRIDKAAPPRTSNSSPVSQAPSYNALSVHFFDSGGDSRRSSTNTRALPPYPSSPPGKTGWAALSDVKVAAATAVPPSYPEDPQEQAAAYPYRSPTLQSPYDSDASIAYSGSVASSSRLPPTFERPETPRSTSHPPYYSPPSSPRLLPTRLRLSSGPGATSPQRPNGTFHNYSPAAYPTPLSSSFSSPSTSFASLPAPGRRLETHRESSLSGSSDSISGGSLASSIRPEQSHADPATQSSPSLASSSSGSDPSHAEQPPPPDSPFVFPSSRSRARPSGNAPSVSGFKFRGRRKAKAPLAKVQVLAPGTPIPAQGVFTAQPQPQPQPRPQPRAPPANDDRRRAPPPPNLRLVPTASAGSGSSGSGPGSPTAPAPPTFYFPSSRTRAHPKSPTQFSFNKGKKKEEGTKPPSFLRMGFRKVVVQPPPAGGLSREVSPMEQTFLMAPPQGERYGTPTPEPPEPHVDYEDLDSLNSASTSASPPVVTKIGVYPLDAYDAALMESDAQAWELLRQLNTTNTPSFYNYGGRPPRNVLDLGCGAGHWMLDAATAWRNSGVQIVGFDMVDTTKGLWPAALRKGVANNIKFVRGNFLKQPLPFSDGSFQLVRMSSLALCIPHEKWEFVLQQARRVLAVGGRLELIDDHIFFPYGKPPLLTPSNGPSQSQSSRAPHLDMMIPSTVFSRMSLADVVNPNISDDTDSEIYNLYGVEEEEEEEQQHSDADTIGSGPRRERRMSARNSGRSSSTSSLSGSPPDPEAWHEQAASARELEALFEHMVNVKFGIHLRPSEFILEMLMHSFGGAREVAVMHLTLAPPDYATAEGQSANQRPSSLNGPPRGRPESDTLGHCPGLILWPSTFIPMPLPELETHASKHLRMLLSCKSALVDYAAEIADQSEGETQGEAAMEALWEYQNFLRERFNPPPDDPSRAMSDASSSAGDANSIRNSIYSVSSVGSEARDAMREYQSELHTHFEWASDAARALRDAPTLTPTPALLVEGSPPSASASASTASRVRKSRSRGSRGRDRSSSVASSMAPPYSRIELTHVRTFYVYEAVKLADGRFGGTI
ncbi:hypothetical protein DFH09DRAFT_289947 [Mycena vulgaris]|nr:hypothetical protein DFH09DRAFT_289947 [Mycena vulgaris]